VASVDAAEPMRDKKPVLFMHDIMLNAPPETPFGTAMGAFSPENYPATYPQNGAKFCSNSFDKPANLVFGDATGEMVWVNIGDKPTVYIPASVTLTIGDKVERYTIHEPFSEDDGAIYGALVESSDSNNPERWEVYSAKIGDTEIAIFRDRVFWPCEEELDETPRPKLGPPEPEWFFHLQACAKCDTKLVAFDTAVRCENSRQKHLAEGLKTSPFCFGNKDRPPNAEMQLKKSKTWDQDP
jgi:hypothetical protein